MAQMRRSNLSLMNWWGVNHNKFSATVLKMHILQGVQSTTELKMAPSKLFYAAVSKLYSPSVLYMKMIYLSQGWTVKKFTVVSKSTGQYLVTMEIQRMFEISCGSNHVSILKRGWWMTCLFDLVTAYVCTFAWFPTVFIPFRRSAFLNRFIVDQLSIKIHVDWITHLDTCHLDNFSILSK